MICIWRVWLEKIKEKKRRRERNKRGKDEYHVKLTLFFLIYGPLFNFNCSSSPFIPLNQLWVFPLLSTPLISSNQICI